MNNNPLFIDSTHSPVQVIVLGECMIELSGNPLEPLTQRFSGDTLNTAIYLKRLIHDLPIDVHYATAVGRDAFSEAMIVQWQNEGLGCDYVTQLEDKNPGLYFIQVDATGERSFRYWRNDSAAKQYLEQANSSIILDAITQSSILYISGISLAILPNSSRLKLLAAIKKMRSNGGKLVFDNNYRPLLWQSKTEAISTYQTFMSECDLALLTLDDEVLMHGQITSDDVLARCNDLGISEVVIKRGSESCLIQYNSQMFEVPSVKVNNVVDTTAAGDSFSAAYLAGRLSGCGPEESARLGHKLASTVIQYSGAIIDKKHSIFNNN